MSQNDQTTITTCEGMGPGIYKAGSKVEITDSAGKRCYWVKKIVSATEMTVRPWRWYDPLSHLYWDIRCRIKELFRK